MIDVYPLIQGQQLQTPSRLTSADTSEIKSLVFYEEKNMLLAGFASGNLGAWELSADNTFNFRSLDKIHQDVNIFL